MLFISCKSINHPIISYAKTSSNGSEKVYIFEKKVTSKSVVNILIKEPVDNKFSRSKYITDEKCLQLKEKYKNDTINEKWSNHDFKDLNYKIISNDFIYLKNKTPEVFKDNKFLFAFSKPIYLNNKKVIFYVSEGTKIGFSNFSGIVIMEKKKNEWVLIEKIESKELN
jgi:hypothetical protein